MPSEDEIVDNFSGMITRKQAQILAEGLEYSSVAQHGMPTKEVTNVKGLLEFAAMKGSPAKGFVLSASKQDIYVVNLEDRIYRIFNLMEYGHQLRKLPRRTVVLGAENSAIRLNLFGKTAEFIDINGFEAGDLILIKNVLFDIASGELRSTGKTVISRLSPSYSGITDYSMLKDGMKNISVIGKVIEIDPIKYVSRLNSEGQIAVARCKISDLVNTIAVSLWESSAIATTKLNLNDFVKLEFCSVRLRNDSLEIYCNNLSRVLVNNVLSTRLKKRA